jgi:acetylornithine deacetylase
VVEVFEAWGRDAGLALGAVGNNRWVERRGAGAGPTLLLLSHYDTVPATPAWTRDPWTPTREGDRLYGLGSNDAKGCLAAMMEAFLAANVSCGRVILVAAAEEEVGRNGFETVLPQLPSLDGAIVGEPTGLDIATAQNGLLVLDCVATGRAGHAARPHLAENALYAMARDLLVIESLSLPRTHPRGGATTCVATVAQAGERHNVIPGEARWTLDLRTTDAYTVEELVALVRSRVQSAVTVRSARFVAVSTPAGADVLAAAYAGWGRAVEFASPTLSDWAHLHGVSAVKWGPGRSERSHTADEWVEVSQVEAAVGAYRIAIETFLGCGGD